DLARHRDTGGLDLAVGEPAGLQRLEPVLAELHALLTAGEPGTPAAVLLAELDSLRGQHQRLIPPLRSGRWPPRPPPPRPPPPPPPPRPPRPGPPGPPPRPPPPRPPRPSPRPRPSRPPRPRRRSSPWSSCRPGGSSSEVRSWPV